MFLLSFGIGLPSTNRKALLTSKLVLQDREVVDLQGLLVYLICESKDNYIVYLVLGQEDQSLSKLYKPSSSTTVSKIKQEPQIKKESSQIKKESKHSLLKKVKQEPKIKQESRIKV